MNPHLRRVVALDNRWLEGEPHAVWCARHLPAPYLARRLVLIPDDRVTLLVGPRQCGKSTLIWHTVAAGGRPTLFLNCEEPSLRDWLHSPAAFLADLEEWLGTIPDLFFDEIQNLPEAGLFLKGLVDRKTGRHLFATGSSSFDLEAATRESLAGRARRHLLLPYSLHEIAAALPSAGATKLLREAGLREAAGRLALHGSYPGVHASADPVLELAGLVEAFVVRDASDRFRLRNPGAFRRILELAASQIGNLVNLSEWAGLVGVSADTVAEHARLLEETHVLRLLRPFIGGKRAELTQARKVYFLDNGIRNQLFGGFAPLDDRPDRGALLENLVFTELAKSVHPLLDTISYWRSKSGAELDFVVQHRGRLLACEVKAGDVRATISRSARSFVEAYEPETLLVVSREPHPPQELGKTAVRFVAVTELAGWVEGFVGR